MLCIGLLPPIALGVCCCFLIQFIPVLPQGSNQQRSDNSQLLCVELAARTETVPAYVLISSRSLRNCPFPLSKRSAAEQTKVGIDHPAQPQ